MLQEPLNTAQMKQVLEAALLTAGQPLSLDELLRPFDGRMERATLRMLLDELKTDWQQRSMELVQVASGWRFQARPDFSPYLPVLIPSGSSAIRAPRWRRWRLLPIVSQ